MPPLHVHLHGKDPSPWPRFPISSHVCPYIHHLSAPGLPVLVPWDCTRWPRLPGPSPSGFTAAWTAHGNMASGWLTFTPQEPPSPPTLSAIALPLPPPGLPQPCFLCGARGTTRQSFGPAHCCPNLVLCPARWPPCPRHRLLVHKAPAPFLPSTQLD